MTGRALVLLLAGTGLGLVARAGTVALADMPNPHGAVDGCASCHAPGASPTEAGDVLPIIEACRSCHPTADMHPVGVPQVDVHVAEGFPLDNGVLTCATCHAEPAHEGFSDLKPPYHRGGPYPRPDALCYTCHENEEYVRSDPHHPASWRSAMDPTCSACHTTEPEDGAAAEQANLRLPLDETCTTCHEGEIHLGVTTHLGKALSVLDSAHRREEVPVTAEGKVECWSCHDVHGATPSGSAVVSRRWKSRRALSDELRAHVLADEWSGLPEDLTWPGNSDDEHPPLLALPVEDGALCRACHGNGP